MNMKFHSSIVTCGLTFALCLASPAIAMAEGSNAASQNNTPAAAQQSPQAVISNTESNKPETITTDRSSQDQLAQGQLDDFTSQTDVSPKTNQSDLMPSENENVSQPKSNQAVSQDGQAIDDRGEEGPVEEDPLPALPEDGWHTNEDGTLSYYKNGAFLTGLQILGDDTYYFGADGHSRRWIQNIEGSTYYFDGSYKMHKGLLRWNATKDYSYFDDADGRAHTGLYKGYYFGANARSKRWTQNIDGNTYYFDDSYKMHKGLLRWNATKDYSYFGDADGVMIKDSFTPSRTYYMGTNGRSLRWTQNIDGNTYYFDGSYKMHKGLLRWNATKDYSYFGDADGVMIKNSFTPSRTYYMGTNGRSLRWTQNIGGHTYYFNEAYKMHKGLLRWNATKDYSYFGTNGAMVLNSFITPTAHKTYYFNNKGRSLRWLQTINERKYYFNATYLMHTGWLRWNSDNTFSYFEDSPSSNQRGAMYTGVHTFDGTKIDFGKNGKITASHGKLGYQNPSWMVQLSPNTVWGAWRNKSWPFNYASPSRISRTASRSDCVETFIKRAKDYLGTTYIWDYACAPGVGVDCAGLVLQCAYACGMNFGSMNPHNHYYKGLNGGYHAAYANAFWTRGDLKHVSLSSRKRGDLISWEGHIAIYLGNDRMIEAAPGEGVITSNIWRYNSTPRGIIRLFH
ncbi:C40 family peptidase [Olegusella massiliensis]|uniref:C40 family peptidase n=1 Tax=Olegusella massiliensis TaxID=1776381 RepID=UPI0040556C8C